MENIVNTIEITSPIKNLTALSKTANQPGNVSLAIPNTYKVLDICVSFTTYSNSDVGTPYITINGTSVAMSSSNGTYSYTKVGATGRQLGVKNWANTMHLDDVITNVSYNGWADGSSTITATVIER